MSTELAEIEAAFTPEYRYEPLGLLQERLLAAFPDGELSEQAGLLQAAMLQRRCEWSLASALLIRLSKVYPDSDTILYEGAQNSIDAGLYAEAAGLLHTLAPRIPRLSDRQLRGVWRTACLVGMHDLGMQAFTLAEQRASAFASETVRARLTTALANYAEFDIPIVSIGENCLPWMMVNRWGLRRAPHDPRNHTIFNLGQTQTRFCHRAILDKGASLVSPEALGIITTPNGTPFPQNFHLGFDFNHEQGPQWIDNNFRRLRERYAERSAAFETFLDGPRRVFFHYTDHEGSIRAVVDALRTVNANPDYRVVVIDVLPTDRGEAPPRTTPTSPI